MLTYRYNTLKITFGFLDCPSCKQEIFIDYQVPLLGDLLTRSLEFKSKIESLALVKAREEGLDKKGPVVT